MKIYRAFATVGGLTLVSRALGFIRDILIAAVLGTGLVADAFFVAFRFPNLFRRLFGEGAFNSAFVPLFTKRIEGEGMGAANQFAREAASVLITALLIFTALCEIAMPWLLPLIAPGFVGDPEQFDLAVLLTRITFPYLACMSLVALLSGVLNALDRFAVAAAAPILLNLVLIAVMAFVWAADLSLKPEAGIWLAWGVAFAGVVQLVSLWIAARAAGSGLSFGRPRLTPGVRRLFTLGIPGVIAGGITQINILVGTIIASFQAGAVSYLYYADRLYQLPLGVVGIAIGVVLLPELSRKLRSGDAQGVMASQNRSLEFSLLLTVPAAVALVLVPHEILRVLFERGAFTASDTRNTALALSAFAIGLPAFVLIKVFSPAFFAREDTRTPMRFAGYSMIVNVVGSLALFFGFQRLGLPAHVGIAIATSIAGWVNALLLFSQLKRDGLFQGDVQLRRNLPKIFVVSLAMGGALLAARYLLAPGLESEASDLIQFASLAALVGSGLAVLLILIPLTGLLSLRSLLKGGRAA